MLLFAMYRFTFVHDDSFGPRMAYWFWLYINRFLEWLDWQPLPPGSPKAWLFSWGIVVYFVSAAWDVLLLIAPRR